MTLGIVTHRYGNPPYGGDALAVIRAYCGRWGLPFLVGGPSVPRRHPVWGKVPIIATALRDWDEVIYLDLDAVPAELERPWHLELLALAGSVLTCGEGLTGALNTGVVLARRGTETTAALDAWWCLPSYWAWRAPYDEGRLAELSSSVRLVPRTELDLVDGAVVHPYGLPLAKKTARIAGLRQRLAP